jgi:hypothetical protein
MPLTYDEPITFGSGGSAARLNCTGIDFAEAASESWTSAPVAELDIQLPFARHDVALELEASPFLVPDVVPAQRLFIFLGGMFLGFCTLRGHARRAFSVNRNTVSGRDTRLSLVLPDAISPQRLRMSEDQRELGICLTSIVFRTIS